MPRVLIAEDDRDMAHYLGGVLEDGGWEVSTAFDAMQTFMFAMKAPQPDLILLDIGMPAGSGLQALQKLKMSAKTSRIPVVVVTGKSDAATKAETERLGAKHFLPKPVDPDLLLETVTRLVPGRA